MEGAVSENTSAIGREQLWRIWHYLHTQYGASEQDAIRIICFKWQYYWQAFSTERSE